MGLLAAQVLFHLQTRQPAVLPPVCELFGVAPDHDALRPLHDKRPPDMALLKVPSWDSADGYVLVCPLVRCK